MTSPGRHVERESTLAVGASFTVPELDGVAGRTVALPDQHTVTRYVDTADQRLWRRAVTLRHRSGEGPGDGTWTLKLPADEVGDPGTVSTLDRMELTWPGRPETVPDAAVRVLHGLVRRDALTPMAELHSIRRRLLLQDPSGTSWGELDDDTVTVSWGGSSFRQIEVELVGEGPAHLDEVVEALRAAGARPDPETKVAKALRLSGRSGTAPPRVEVGPRSTMGDLVRDAIGRGVDQLVDHDVRLRLDSADPAPEDVHQARVATRRLRSDLQLVGGALDPVWLAHTRAELRWLGGVLGTVRDADVLSGSLRAAGSVLEAGGTLELRASLDDQRRAAARELAAALEDPRYLALLDQLEAASVHPPLARPTRGHGTRTEKRPAAATARSVLPRLVRRRYRALRRAVRSAGRHPTDQQLHRIRIRAKQLRYSAESAVPVLGAPAGRLAAAAEDLQSVLGEHHDSVAAELWLRRQVASGSRSSAFSAGVLVAGEHRLQRRLRHRWRPVADRLDRPSVRRFLR